MSGKKALSALFSPALLPAADTCALGGLQHRQALVGMEDNARSLDVLVRGQSATIAKALAIAGGEDDARSLGAPTLACSAPAVNPQNASVH